MSEILKRNDLLKTRDGYFEFNIRHAHGLISKKCLAEVEIFIRGYDLGYNSSLDH